LAESIPSEVREKINAQVASVLFAPIAKEADELSRDAVIDEITDVFDQAQETGTITPLDWRLERKSTVIFSSPTVVTIDTKNHGYLGGAHGFEERTLMTFDTTNGERLALTDLVGENSQSVFDTVAEIEFRRVRNIPPGQSLKDAGFALDGRQTFLTSRNFGVVADGILLHFNPYDVAPYSMGATDVLLSRDLLLPLLEGTTPKLSHLFGGGATAL